MDKLWDTQNTQVEMKKLVGIYLFITILFILEKERGGGEKKKKREREREKHGYEKKHRPVASYTHPNQGLNSKPGMYPDLESNPSPFGVWDDASTH